jgi:hypothetical protein
VENIDTKKLRAVDKKNVLFYYKLVCKHCEKVQWQSQAQATKRDGEEKDDS